MYWSKNLLVTSKEKLQSQEAVSHQLMLRAGLIRQVLSGVYSYLPLGLRVLKKIEGIIREEMNSISAVELLLSCLQPLELWMKTGRDKEMGETMFKFVDRKKRKLCLGPTHEEMITQIASAYIHSYKQLPLILYQIQTKFRDEIRPRFGLVRSCEFIMKDAYSFDMDEQGLDENYKKAYRVYEEIFRRCGLPFVVIEAEPGVMGGSLSHEFMVPAESGEDKITQDGITQPAIEVGHIFKLGAKYSKVLKATYLDPQGKSKPLVMGCYGIGVSRLIPAIVEKNYDSEGLIWPKEISPFQVHILPINFDHPAIKEMAVFVHQLIEKEGIEVLLDDRDEQAGVKFKDADLLGIPLRITIGQEGLNKGCVEIKLRKTQEVFLVKKGEILQKLKELL